MAGSVIATQVHGRVLSGIFATMAIIIAIKLILPLDGRTLTREVPGGWFVKAIPVAIGAFNSMHALSRRNDAPQKASRPFDKERDGFVFSEGGACLVLEGLDFAIARGARVLGEVSGYGSTAWRASILMT